MIKITELRLGNYVYAGNKIERVLEIYPDSITTDSYTHIFDFLPVELTPDILEAAGFKYNQLTENYEVFYDCVGMLGINKYDGSFVIANDNEDMGFTGDLKSSCKYLHQLQNLIYCLTGEELQIDITKLNKEK